MRVQLNSSVIFKKETVLKPLPQGLLLRFEGEKEDRFELQAKPVQDASQLYEARSTTFQVKRPSGGMLRMRRWEGSKAAKVLAKNPASPFSATSFPLSKKVAPVLIVHGGGSSSAWMSPLAWPLAEKHSGVYGVDIENVGYVNPSSYDDKSKYPIGNLENYDNLVSQVRDAVNWLSEVHDSPVFVIGQSMGAAMVTLLASEFSKTEEDKSRLKGMVFISPAFQFFPGSLTAGFKANYYGEYALQKFGLDWEPIRFPAQHSLELLTSNTEKHQLSMKATDKITQFTPGSWIEMEKMMKATEETASNVDIPVLMLLSKQDRVTDPQVMESVFDDYRSIDKQIIFYNKLENGDPVGHDLVWEPEILPNMTKTISRWLTARSVVIEPEGEKSN